MTMTFLRTTGHHLRAICTAAAMSLLIGVSPVSAQESDKDIFSDVQKEAIGEVIRDYLIANPQLMLEVMEALDAYESQAEAVQQRVAIEANREALERDGYSFIAGNPDGAITVVEFFDYRCPYCKQTGDDMAELIKRNDDVRLVLKEFPILGPNSTIASRAAIAAIPQGNYLNFHFALLAVEGTLDREKVMEVAEAQGIDVDKLANSMESERVDKIIDDNRTLAREIGVRGTPAIVIGDELVPGAAPLDVIEARIQAIRDAAAEAG